MNSASAATAPNRLQDLAVSDRGFVFDPTTGATFTVNETAAEILRALMANADRAAVRAALEDRFDVRGFDLDRDLGEFVLQLREHGLLPEGFTL